MGARYQRLIGEAGRFLAVGGVATLVALVIFNLLVHGLVSGSLAVLADQPITAYVLANTVGMMISYRGTRHWAFADRPPHHADGGRSAFVVINVVTMLLPIGCLMISRDVLGLDDPVSDNVAANVVGLTLGLAARFALYRTVVFRRPIHLNDIYPAADGQDDEPARLAPHEPGAPASAASEAAVGESGPVSEPATSASRGGPTPPPALGATEG